jgi:hypothetical protein
MHGIGRGARADAARWLARERLREEKKAKRALAAAHRELTTKEEENDG